MFISFVKMMEDGIQTHVNIPKVLKNMQEYLGNPQTIKALYDALKAMPPEEFYDLHENELWEVYHMYMELGNIFDLKTNNDHMRYEISKMIRLKENVGRVGADLLHALQSYPTENCFAQSENEKQIVYEQQIKKIFENIIQYLAENKKRITIDGVDYLKRNVIERLQLVKKIEDDSLAKSITYLLKNHVFTGSENVDKALQHLMEIHGEDISRPLLGGKNIPQDYTWDSLLFMQYGFGQINIDEVLSGLKLIGARNNAAIQDLLKDFIPLYSWLHAILQKTNEESIKDDQLVVVQNPGEELKINTEKKIDIKAIADYSYQNDCLKIVLKTDKSLLEQKLLPLKKICDLSKMDIFIKKIPG